MRMQQVARTRAMVVGLSLLALAGCGGSGISTTPFDPAATGPQTSAGTPYQLPKGLVAVQVFADATGIALQIEPAQMVADGEIGTLVARAKPSPFNDEKTHLTADPATGFLATVSSDSTAQLLAIVQEAAKTAGRLSLQNAKATFLESTVVVFQDTFDPLSGVDTNRINEGIRHAFERASRAYENSGRGPRARGTPHVMLSVDMGSAPVPVEQAAYNTAQQLQNCQIGICVRAMTARRIVVSVDGRPFASKVVNIPTREIIAVPVPQTILSDQQVMITVKDGILSNYELDRKSEALGLVKIPGAIIDGVVSGLTQSLTDTKSITDKRTDVVNSEATLAKAKADAITSLKLQSGTLGDATPSGAYLASTLTVYPYSQTLADAIRALPAKAAIARPPSRVSTDGSLLDKKPGGAAANGGAAGSGGTAAPPEGKVQLGNPGR